MIPKFRLWNRITSQLHIVDGLYFDAREAEYVDDDNVLRFVGFKNIDLMQSTGLKDKNGKEIFEGDIAQFEDCYTETDFLYVNTGIVEWSQGSFTITNRDSVLMEDLLDGDVLDVEIIGNVYENPELLEELR